MLEQRGLSSFHIKLLAAITMLIDHIGAVLYPEVDWLRAIGRISFPLFVWLLVQGEAHTRDIWRYGLRLVLLGLISQPIYQLTFGVTDLNILFQLSVGLVCLRLARQWPDLQILVWLAGAAVTEVLNMNYGSYGIVLVLLTRYFRPNFAWCLVWVGFHLVWARFMGPFQLPAAVIPLFFFWANGQRGPKARWFYAFYPGHLALLALIARGIGVPGG
ncbi:TraX family protein [Pseudanabaena sp. FACHB-2040]|uniref:TraX family protein n=1 Tax=Pseudanabaena sp. FACHB-2040 TaxID=2692859 RepID=UPI00168A2020|nr:TraX family protein [Pseudanabaena sp. FACHB-2040]MBD2258319.1 TraX family protein [Pseudanabaena sp. FACHB-2040]